MSGQSLALISRLDVHSKPCLPDVLPAESPLMRLMMPMQVSWASCMCGCLAGTPAAQAKDQVQRGTSMHPCTQASADEEVSR